MGYFVEFTSFLDLFIESWSVIGYVQVSAVLIDDVVRWPSGTRWSIT